MRGGVGLTSHNETLPWKFFTAVLGLQGWWRYKGKHERSELKSIERSKVLLIVQKSGVHQLRLVVYPIIYKVLAPSQVVVWDFSVFRSHVFFLFQSHRPYFPLASWMAIWPKDKSGHSVGEKKPLTKIPTGWWFQFIVLFLPRNLGEMIQIDYIIFFKGVETVNHQLAKIPNIQNIHLFMIKWSKKMGTHPWRTWKKRCTVYKYSRKNKEWRRKKSWILWGCWCRIYFMTKLITNIWTMDHDTPLIHLQTVLI